MQSINAVDSHLEKEIWWDMDNWQKKSVKNVQGNLRVHNHLEGRLDKETLTKHMANEDLFIFNGSSYYRGFQCAAVFVPPSIMGRLD